MGQVLLLLVVALTVAAVIFGVTVLVTGRDPGLAPAEPDGRAVPLPGSRPLMESDIGAVRFDTALRGYRMAQVDQAMRRAAYDIGYKTELIGVLEAEVEALRAGRLADADALRRAREVAAGGAVAGGVAADSGPPEADSPNPAAAGTAGAAPENPAAGDTAGAAPDRGATPAPSAPGSPLAADRLSGRTDDLSSEPSAGNDRSVDRLDQVGEPGAAVRSEWA